jgi:murein L,D-transpeptidase YcbB/YkuD
MYKAQVGRFFAGAFSALIIALPGSALAQQNVVVPIPSSADEQAASPSNPTNVTPPDSVPSQQTPSQTPKKESAVERKDSAPVVPPANMSAVAPAPAAKEKSSKDAAAVPLAPANEIAAKTAAPVPPVREKRAATRGDDVPLPRSAPAATAPLPVPAPAQKAATVEAAPAANPEAAAQKPAADVATEGKVASDKPALSEADAQVAARLQETVTDSKQLARRVARGADRSAMATFYGARDFAPLWTHDGRLTGQAKGVIARLKDAAADGLDPASYRVPEFPAGNPSALAIADVMLTNSVLTFARQLADGRIAPSRVYEQVDYGDHTPAPADILKTISEANKVDAAFESFNPPDRGFRALKHKLAELRGKPDGEKQTIIPLGHVIKPGAQDERVPLLRARLGIKGKSSEQTYDRALVRAVQKLQESHGINPSGIVGRETLAVLNEPKSGQATDRIIANMERWRWMPRELGATYVMVNIPDYSLKLVHNNRAVWHTKIVAGKPATPTPLANASMDNVIVNPSWHVPQSIIQNELLPRYQEDPNIFDRMGLEVKRGRDGNLVVVQPPGAANALGQIKFNFPNKFQVYLHDTPEKRLFKAERRAFSHGCMRVENPTKFGELILHLGLKKNAPNAKQIEAMFGSDEHVFKLADKPQVLLTYQTAFVDDAGKLQLRDDVYGFDGRIIDIMHGREPRAAVTGPQAPKPDAHAEVSNEDVLRRMDRREAFNPQQLNPLRLFDGIFR